MMDPRRIQFQQQPRQLIDDPDERGLNCKGCIFERQRAAVCQVASEEATRRGLRDCDAVDQFGDVVIYVPAAVDPRQMDLIGDRNDLDES
jgi:hypothetical protein